MNVPAIGELETSGLFYVTCERCGGLYALGDTRDQAIICWNDCVDGNDKSIIKN